VTAETEGSSMSDSTEPEVTETVEQPAAETVAETPAETVVETPAEPVAETVVETPAEPVAETVVETPAETVVVVETPAPAPVRAPRPGDRPIQTVGRRKEAIVRVRLVPGTGKITCNGRDLEAYFPSKVHQQLIREPLATAEKTEIFDVYANLHGGGITGQAGALRLGIARALIENEPDDRPALKKAGFLTRDSRVKESKKYGLKKARKAPQYSKR
jgi:small subunit ribosomal protein S9